MQHFSPFGIDLDPSAGCGDRGRVGKSKKRAIYGAGVAI